MGMHFGIVAARAPWQRFFDALRQVTGDFIERGAVPRIEDCDLGPADDGFPVVGGEYALCSYLLDKSMILSTDFDRLADLSSRLGCTLAACCGETVSGSYYWILAENGDVRRLYANCTSAIREPFQMGVPLPTESVNPLEDLDGDGFVRALELNGFDYGGWLERGTKTAFLYTCKESGAPRQPKGPLGKAFDDHWKRFEIPDDDRPKPTVVSRRLADGSTGYDIVSRAPKRSLLNSIRSMFRKG